MAVFSHENVAVRAALITVCRVQARPSRVPPTGHRSSPTSRSADDSSPLNDSRLDHTNPQIIVRASLMPSRVGASLGTVALNIPAGPATTPLKGPKNCLMSPSKWAMDANPSEAQATFRTLSATTRRIRSADGARSASCGANQRQRATSRSRCATGTGHVLCAFVVRCVVILGRGPQKTATPFGLKHAHASTVASRHFAQATPRAIHIIPHEVWAAHGARKLSSKLHRSFRPCYL